VSEVSVVITQVALLLTTGQEVDIKSDAGLAWLIHQKQNRSAECGSVTEERLGSRHKFWLVQPGGPAKSVSSVCEFRLIIFFA